MPFGRWRSTPPPPDADSFTAEALEHLDALYGTALRLTRRQEDAQDLVQDTFLKAFRARARFAAGTNLRAWLYTILHNTWRNRRRDQSRSRVEADSDVVDLAAERGETGGPPALTPEDLLLRDVMSEDLQAALEGLPEAFREVVWLRDVDDLSYHDIATVLSVPMGTVMSRLARGRRQLHAGVLAARRATPR